MAMNFDIELEWNISNGNEPVDEAPLIKDRLSRENRRNHAEMERDNRFVLRSLRKTRRENLRRKLAKGHCVLA